MNVETIAPSGVTSDRVVEAPGEYWGAPRIAEGYDRGRFSSLHGRLYRWREEHVISLALGGVKPGARVLDAACGTGRITELLARRGFKPSGADVSSAMLAVARRRLHPLALEIALVESRAEGLPCADGSFDAVTCIGLLMHLDHRMRSAVLRELARVSRGPLVVQYGCTGTLVHLRARLTGTPPGGVRFAISEIEMRDEIERCGLAIRSRRWVLRGVSTSAILELVKSE